MSTLASNGGAGVEPDASVLGALSPLPELPGAGWALVGAVAPV